MIRNIATRCLALLFPLLLWAQPEKVSLQLSWYHQFQFAGFYIAKERGYYADAGLEVEIREFHPGVTVVDDVLSGKSDFGISPSSLILDFANGKPVVALGAVFQQSPAVLITTDPDIRSVTDLKGKRIMITPNQARAAAIFSMLRSHGIKPDEFIRQSHSADINDLIAGRTDAMACYRSNEPFALDQKGVSYRIFDPKEHGFQFYGDLIFTSQKLIDKAPDRARRFYEASVRGWEWAFAHIDETAALIRDRYNSQGKSLAHLIYEGEVLRGLALNGTDPFGTLDRNKLEQIASVYHLFGLCNKIPDLIPLADPIGFGKQSVSIGILAKRGEFQTLERWEPLADYLNRMLPRYRFEIIPIEFQRMEETVRDQAVDFVLTNTMNYVQLEYRFGLTRIATLKNLSRQGQKGLSNFGSVIIAPKGSQTYQIEDIRGKRFAAVDPNSFGGWIIAYELLQEHYISEENIDLTFYGSHDAVVYALLNGKADFGSVRTDTLESMADEGKIKLDQFQVIAPKTHRGFNYLTSTRLYPEWPFSRLANVDDDLAAAVMSALIMMPVDAPEARKARIAGWAVPMDYSSVHKTLQNLNLYPYERHRVGLRELFDAYAGWIYFFGVLFILFVMRQIHLKTLYYKLDQQVKERTRELNAANAHLQELADTDALTGIFNRRRFLELANQYFDLARRNETPLQLLMIDIDHFKQINDTYGHQTGDQILQSLCNRINPLLRRSDIFGRIGGEEFAICLQNTSAEGAWTFAERIIHTIRQHSHHTENGREIRYTISLGVAELTDETRFEELLAKSDEALYAAKNAGRDCIRVHAELTLE